MSQSIQSPPPASEPGPAAAPAPRILHCGDGALVVEFGDRVDRAVSAEVLRLRARLAQDAPDGVTDLVPTFRSLAIHYDPGRTRAARLREAVDAALASDSAWEPAARLWDVPVCYEEGYAPDLVEVAERTGLDPAEVVEIHSGARYYAYMLGFTPGFAYLGDVDPRLELPRRQDPRVRVPVGSVCIATTLTAIYPQESPGGWHLVGTTPISMFDASLAEPALFAAADWIEFFPVDAAEFESIREDTRAGRYRVRARPAP